MGASDRYCRRAPMPLPIWIIDPWIGGTGRQMPRPGMLLDWRQVIPDGCAPHWEGLVLTAGGGGERGWQVELSWQHASHLQPMDVHPPAS